MSKGVEYKVACNSLRFFYEKNNRTKIRQLFLRMHEENKVIYYFYRIVLLDSELLSVIRMFNINTTCNITKV